MLTFELRCAITFFVLAVVLLMWLRLAKNCCSEHCVRIVPEKVHAIKIYKNQESKVFTFLPWIAFISLFLAPILLLFFYFMNDYNDLRVYVYVPLQTMLQPVIQARETITNKNDIAELEKQISKVIADSNRVSEFFQFIIID